FRGCNLSWAPVLKRSESSPSSAVAFRTQTRNTKSSRSPLKKWTIRLLAGFSLVTEKCEKERSSGPLAAQRMVAQSSLHYQTDKPRRPQEMIYAKPLFNVLTDSRMRIQPTTHRYRTPAPAGPHRSQASSLV